MTPADLAAIEERCAKATEGPWRHYGGQSVYGPENTDIDIAEATLKADAACIAHARTDIPALLAEVRRLELEVSGYRRDVDNCLGELQHKNAVLRDRDAEIGRLQSDNERIRRGLAVAVERGKQNTPFGACVIAENLLAGREWSDAEVD